MAYLTKTRFTEAENCLKKLYLTTLHPELKADVAPDQQARLDEGNRIGELARGLYPDGILIERGPGASQRTKAEIANGTLTLFEAAFSHSGVYVVVDILHRDSVEAPWELIEVKSSTKRKPAYQADIAVQTWAVQGKGFAVKGSFLLLINKRYRGTPNEPVFTKEDVTDWIAPKVEEVPHLVRNYFGILKNPEPPEVSLGGHCYYPYPCPFLGECWKDVPEESVWNLYNVPYEKRAELYRSGIVSLSDPRLTESFEPPTNRQIRVARTRKLEIDKPLIQSTLKSWTLPYYYLDFETISFSLPQYPGTSAYQQVPMQFSIHVQAQPEGETTHFGYLHDSLTDPRRPLAEQMLKDLKTQGTILSFYRKFEIDRIKEMAEAFPDLAPSLLALVPRIEDPQELFRDAVGHPDFNGSFSLKVLAPVILGEEFDYSQHEISSGASVQWQFLEMLDSETHPERQAIIRNNLLEYCHRDTQAMVKLVDWLWQISR